MNAKTASPIPNSSPGVASADSISVVGITPAGEVPLVADGSAIRLPQCCSGPAALRDVQERLREETGYEAVEFVLMTVPRPAEKSRPGPTILLAPRLSRVGPRPRGLELVPLAELRPWLDSKRAEGSVVDRRVSLGILMAERHFPHWALARLQDALRQLRPARPSVAVSG